MPAIWLARRGWMVTAIDISEVAVSRAREAGSLSGAPVEWVCGDALRTPFAARSFDLVSMQYPALPKAAGEAAVRRLLDARVLTEALVLSTCNRVELYGVCEAGMVERTHLWMLDALARNAGMQLCEVRRVAVQREGPHAVQHLMSVAAGLESMVMGESQIVAQLKKAIVEHLGRTYASR